MNRVRILLDSIMPGGQADRVQTHVAFDDRAQPVVGDGANRVGVGVEVGEHRPGLGDVAGRERPRVAPGRVGEFPIERGRVDRQQIAGPDDVQLRRHRSNEIVVDHQRSEVWIEETLDTLRFA